MTKITAGFFWNEKLHRKEYITVVLPQRMFVYCKWCGNIASKIMYLIKQEDDMKPLEKKYSELCSCDCKWRANV